MTTVEPFNFAEGAALEHDGLRLRTSAPANRRWERRYVTLLLAIDSVIALGAAVAAYLIRFGTDNPNARVDGYLLFSVALPVAWIATAALVRAFEPRFLFVGAEEFRRVLFCGLILTAGVALVSYAFRLDVARGYVLVALPMMTLGDLLARYVARKWVHRVRVRQGRLMRRVMLVGHEEGVVALATQLHRQRYHGMQVVGACLPPGYSGDTLTGSADGADGLPVFGDFDRVPAAARAAEADTVAVLGCPEIDSVQLRRMAWGLETTRVDLVVAPALMDVTGPRISVRPVDGLPLLHVEHPSFSGGRRLAKTVFDRVVAAMALLVFSPLLLAIAIAVRLDSDGPATFRQERVGRNGQPFKMLKFRSMFVDAEARLAGLQEQNKHGAGVLFKIEDDPRITRLGHKLRHYSLDELPQLINVLKGDMSLVGPRPALQHEVDQYGFDVRRRLAVQPGMTGLWQVSGRADLTWAESERIDLRYVENWSLALDLVILWRTVFAVLRSEGAY